MITIYGKLKDKYHVVHQHGVCRIESSYGLPIDNMYRWMMLKPVVPGLFRLIRVFGFGRVGI